ncbi:hypothetical protein AB4Z52_08235 [Rhizobium sp. 2YAF20]|uniref:hypothetical protein n=1 Tax=Rhizobium sp. 2YAF20 TaxID=3233027 RepID=UPI003F98E558
MANQGGTHEQHVKAGQQSHKSAVDKNQTSSSDQSTDHRAGGRDQQSKGGQRSNKNKH